MSPSPGVRVYRGLLHLYPRSFRREYGDDMVALLAEQLRDEHASRVWSRLLVDIALTVPARHLEAHMNRSSSSSVTLAFVIAAVAGILAVLLGGTSPVPVVVGGSVALVAGSLGVASARRSRTVTSASVTAHWWKLLAGGALALVALTVVTTLTGELPDGGWFVAMFVLLAGLASMATGVVLGLARLGRGRAAIG